MRHETPIGNTGDGEIEYAPAGIHRLKIISVKDKMRGSEKVHQFNCAVKKSWDYQGKDLGEAHLDSWVFDNMSKGWMIRRFAEEVGVSTEEVDGHLIWDDADFKGREFIGVVVKVHKDGQEYTNIRGRFNVTTHFEDILDFVRDNIEQGGGDPAPPEDDDMPF